MNQTTQPIQVRYGPSLIAPHKAVTYSYNHSIFANDSTISPNDLTRLSSLLPQHVMDQLSTEGIKNTNGLLVEIIKTLLNIKGNLYLDVMVKESFDEQYHLSVEFMSEFPTILAIQIAFEIVTNIKRSQDNFPAAFISNINQALQKLNFFTPGELIQKMIFAAKKQLVPYVVLDNSASLVSYGQGHYSVLFNHASSEFNSHIGFNMQKDKSMANAFVKALGYPSTEQKVASSIDMCREIINKTGFPVVIKPLAEGQGKGVTSNIQNMQQADVAFREANKYSVKSVIIEKHVIGDDYRITVSNGKVNGIARMQAASILGDGKNDIRLLIEIENKCRNVNKEKQDSVQSIIIDDKLKRFLGNNQLSLDSIPDKGEQIYLRGTSNLSTGGILTIVEEEDVHPDNLEMAIDITRGFRLDSVGIDFITPDISLSWREVGVIIEINAFPMMSKRLAKKIIANQFAKINNGRIPSTLIVTDDKQFSENVFAEKESKNLKTGFTDENKTLLNGKERMPFQDSFSKRCLSLLINPGCEELVISMTPQRIINIGLPLDSFDHCIIDPKSENVDVAVQNMTKKENLEQWLNDFIGEFVTPVIT